MSRMHTLRPLHFRTVFISDIHPGLKGCRAGLLRRPDRGFNYLHFLGRRQDCRQAKRFDPQSTDPQETSRIDATVSFPQVEAIRQVTVGEIRKAESLQRF